MPDYNIRTGVVEIVNTDMRSFRLAADGATPARPYDPPNRPLWFFLAQKTLPLPGPGDKVILRCPPGSYTVIDIEIINAAPSAPAPQKPPRKRAAKAAS